MCQMGKNIKLKKKDKKMCIRLLYFLCGLSFFGCASTTLIRTKQTGVKVYADGRYLGEGPVVYSDAKIVGSTTWIELKKEGHADQIVTIQRNAQLNPGALIGGILLAPTVVGLAFFLWVLDYQSMYIFDLNDTTQKIPSK